MICGSWRLAALRVDWVKVTCCRWVLVLDVVAALDEELKDAGLVVAEDSTED